MWHTTSEAEEWAWRWGRPTPPTLPRPLRAGPISAGLLAGDQLAVSLGSRQLLSRIGVRVRDRGWRTISPVELTEAVDAGEREFTVRLACRYAAPEIELRSNALITGEPDGTLRYTVRLEALKETVLNRAGLCLLHSAVACAGVRFIARGPHGQLCGELPELVGPQRMEADRIFPLFPGFTELRLELRDGLVQEFHLRGDEFEMEDQRNWTDGSFKTYSTPIGSPVPHVLEPGWVIEQNVVVRLERPADCAHRRIATGPAAEVVLGGPVGIRLPPVGVELDSDGHEPSPAELRTLAALCPAHLRASATAPGLSAVAARAARVAEAFGCPLELAVTLPPDAPSDMLEYVREAVIVHRPLRVLVFGCGKRVTPAPLIQAIRATLGPQAPPLVAGTDMYFAELNRNRPQPSEFDGLAYPITPQVHDHDEAALIESLIPQAVTIRTARTFAGGRPLHVSPVTLRPRWNPFVAVSAPTPAGELPAPVDPRQPSSFAAAWTAGSLHRLADAGAASITYFELTGWRGVIERESGSPLPARFRSRPGQPFPVLAVLACAGAWHQAPLLAVELADPLRTEALAVRLRDATHVLVANLMPSPREVTLKGLPAGPARASRLAPDGGWREFEPMVSVAGESVAVPCDPWSVTWLQAGVAPVASQAERP